MEVPRKVLRKLMCERCRGYLSRGPVHLVDRIKYRCGRCVVSKKDEEECLRMEAYEELAQLLKFPCRYQENGCTSKVPFTENKAHELACAYGKYPCPIAESGGCAWRGRQSELLKHCRQNHPNNVMANACKLTYDITRPSMNSYILFVFNVVFLLQTKVCTAKKKIYHSVRFIDDQARASNFTYTLDIQSNRGKITKHGNVAPRGLMVLQEDTSVATGINSLLEMLGDFKDTTFTVTIESSSPGTSSSTTPDHNTPPTQVTEAKVVCDECGTLTKPVYRRGGWKCTEHAPAPRPCRNSTRGCTYIDINRKCTKHEMYYCQYMAQCYICRKNLTGTTLDSHYTQVHGGITHMAGTVCTVSPADDYKWLIMECDVGRVVCGYRLSHNSDFVLSVYIPLPTAQLYKYRCTVELSHPATGHTLKRISAVQYDQMWDGGARIPRTDYKPYFHGRKVNIKINITKNDDPQQFSV